MNGKVVTQENGPHGFLSPFAVKPAARRLVRMLVWSFWCVYFLFVLLVLSLRYVILPHIENYRPAIERMIGDGIGLQVSIGRIEADWDGIHPSLTLHDLRTAEAPEHPALALSRVEMVLSWRSVAEMRLRLRLLRVDKPTLHVRRGADGQLFVAGIPLVRNKRESEGGNRDRDRERDRDGDGNGIASWVLAQRRVRVDGATLVWKDDLRGAPVLVMQDVNVVLDSRRRNHRFGLTARLPENFASRIDVRGDFYGKNFTAFDAWRGTVFAETGYADLAVWKRWIDYPVELSPYGRGAVRTWLDFAGGGLRGVTADVSLRNVNLGLGKDLPVLNIENLSGRVRADFLADGLAVKGREVALFAHVVSRETEQKAEQKAGNSGEAIVVDPVDFELEWRQNRESGASGAGSVKADRLDIEALARLTAFLPFDARTRQLLGDYAPRGRISALIAHWAGGTERPPAYSLKAEFQDVSLRAKDFSPGFSGITGSLEANETGGKLALDSGESSIDLPAVFPESLIRLDSLRAEASWKIGGGVLEVDLAQADFSSSDASGSAKGTYRAEIDGSDTGVPGVIDMTAELTRADARAVWRYLPYAVSQDARHWLRDSLLAGRASEAKLILKGDLKDFPFEDKDSGQFLVTVKAHDAVLDYGEDWPRIDAIQGDLRFEGKEMTVEAWQGRILGAQLSNTRVQIPDLDAPVSTLLVGGQADGPTAEFLKFIERSPVAGQIDHFTGDMRAAGNGHLDLELSIPLDETRLGESKVAGSYHFTNNEVTADTALPPLRQVNGSLRFSGDGLAIPEISASLLGGPLKIQGGSQKDGRVLIAAEGSVNIDSLRQQLAHPLLAGLTGTVPYHGEIRISGRNADLVIGSNLVGLASSLPDPFAKAADGALPLRFEKKSLPATGGTVRDQLDVSLGTFLEARITRQKTSGGFVPEHGAVAIGRPLRLPEKGLSFGITAERLDLDAWFSLFDTAFSGERSNAVSAWRPDTLSLRAEELAVRGMSWNDVDLSAALVQGAWTMRVDSRQAAGKLVWNGEAGGRIVARFDRLFIDRLPAQSATERGESVGRLPAIDVVAEDFSIRQMKFGRLEMRASNDSDGWNLDHIEASNPHGVLTGKGNWRQGEGDSGSRTQLNFTLDSSSIGGLLARAGYPRTVRGGTARLDGNLAWDGAPTEIDYASMHGDLRLEALKGQFLKLDPGAAGKLLGLISLQNLPRRISLDFKDVFSRGMAFDTITGEMTVQKGVMRTDSLLVDSPSARVSMRGEVDLVRETQHLDVIVQPQLGDTAALGMAIVHPAAGVATWLVSKVLHNPLGTMFAYRYLITGTWDDLKVEKQNAPAAGVDGPPEEPGEFGGAAAP